MITLTHEFEHELEHSRTQKPVTFFVKMNVNINRDNKVTCDFEVFTDSTCRKEITKEIEIIDFSLTNEIKHTVNNQAMVIACNYRKEAV